MTIGEPLPQHTITILHEGMCVAYADHSLTGFHWSVLDSAKAFRAVQKTLESLVRETFDV